MKIYEVLCDPGGGEDAEQSWFVAWEEAERWAREHYSLSGEGEDVSVRAKAACWGAGWGKEVTIIERDVDLTAPRGLCDFLNMLHCGPGAFEEAV